MRKPGNLFEQLSNDEIQALASMLGFNGSSAGFINNLRDMLPVDGEFTMGMLCVIYCQHITYNIVKHLSF